MEIILAEHRGFCYGVTRAVQLAESSLGQAAPICTLGPIIHNPQMVEHLKQNGIGKVESLDEMEQGTIVIRSHGVGPQVYQAAADKNLTIVDATCPHVKKAQQSAKALLETNDYVVVIGEKKHPEVKSIFEWSNQKAYVVETVEEAEALPNAERIGVVSQTTFAGRDFDRITEVLATKCSELEVKRTICTATELRQKAAVELAEKVDIMIVIGGKNSANTTRLAELCAKTGCDTKHIETASELKPEWFFEKTRAGITAGASTPGWIIEEVAEKMETFESAFDVEMKELRKGELVEGTVISIRKDGICVDVGYKSEGFVPAQEVASPTPDDLHSVVAVGDTIRMIVESAKENMDGVVVLSKRKADQRDVLANVVRAFESGELVTGKGVEEVKGGLRVDVCGLRGFIPASHLDIRQTKDIAQYVGQTMELKIIEMDTKKNRIVLSRRVLLERAIAKAEQEALDRIHLGDVVEGTVRRIQDYGVFVDIGGVDALLHVSDMAWEKVKHPSQHFKEGDTVKAVIVKFDAEEKRIGLSLKKLIRDPWLDKADAVKEGTVVVGTVAKLTNFGAFVKIADGLEGLVRMAEISERHIKKAEEALSVGQEVKVKVLTIDKRNKKIALSIRQVQQDAERAEYKAYMKEQEDKNVAFGNQLGDLLKNFEV